jgi:hypothetical protein
LQSFCNISLLRKNVNILKMTQSDIDLLITCSKTITTKRLILQTVDRSLRGGLDAESIIEQKIIKFKIFFRQSVILEEKFSVGLRFFSDDLSEEFLDRHFYKF